ncbi:hypothetical protein [Nonomuraea insulae]|uniref:N-acetyltransferase domain-containing protein n=1 Tax=Nonomuraea insulae TaxID=1616787 RepID=A0ABW1CKT3_9ACTN
MAIEWSRQEVLAAVRTCLSRTGTVTEGYSAVDVRPEPDGMMVIFRWRRDPNLYAIAVEYPTAPRSPWTGLPVHSAYEWAADVAGRLAEELATGLVRRGRRTIHSGYVLLDPRDAPDVCPTGYFIGSVPSHPTEAGSWLAEAGLDVIVPRQLIARGRLACWLQAYVDNERGRPFVGHAAASWENERRTTVRLDLVHILPGVPPEVGDALVRLAVGEAAEAGARRVVTEIDDVALAGLGFRPAPGGSLVLHTEIQRPAQSE